MKGQRGGEQPEGKMGAFADMPDRSALLLDAQVSYHSY